VKSAVLRNAANIPANKTTFRNMEHPTQAHDYIE
jgi:hypothetical protein